MSAKFLFTSDPFIIKFLKLSNEFRASQKPKSIIILNKKVEIYVVEINERMEYLSSVNKLSVK